MADDSQSDEGLWLSITDAAERLSELGDAVDRSTLSRYCKQHGEALELRRDGKANLVDFDALQTHRRENIRLKPVSSPRPGSSERGTASRRFSGSQSDGAARKAQADAEMREMDLARRRRQLTPVAEVDRSARDAVALMQSAFDRAIEGEAAGLSVRYGWDERVVRVELKKFARRGLDVFHREVMAALDAMRREDDAQALEPDAAAPAASAELQ